MKQWIVGLIILLAAGSYAGNDKAVRLAVLAEDVSTESRALADLLTAELSKTAGIQVVERAEIDRVLAEQKLTAAGLTEGKNRILLGKILRANGILFLQKDERKERMSARLVETKQGFQVCQMLYSLKNKKMADLATDIHADVLKSTRKLALDPSTRLLVSIVRIGNVTLSPDYFWIEDELPLVLGAHLAGDPLALVLERRQLGDLLKEAEITAAPATEFRAAGVLIDGEIALTSGAELHKDKMPVTFTIWFRNANQQELAVLRIDGTLDQLEPLTAQMSKAVLKKLRELGPQREGQTVDESKEFLKLAQKQGLLWAAESAHALNVTNEAAIEQLVNSLIKQANATSYKGKRDDYLQGAKSLARAAEFCRDSSSGDLRRRMLVNETGRFLENYQVMVDEEMRDLLRPVRQLVRFQCEKDYIKFMDNNFYYPIFFLRQSSVFFDNPYDHWAYVQAFIDRILNSNDLTYPERVSQAVILIWAGEAMPKQFYAQLAQRREPEVRYAALEKLFSLSVLPAEKHEIASQALDLIDPIYENMDFVVRLKQRTHYPSGSDPGLLPKSIITFIDVCPEKKERCVATIITQLQLLLENGNLNAFIGLDPLSYFPLFPPDEVINMIDETLALKAQGKRVDLPASELNDYFSELKKCRSALIERYHPDMMAKPEIEGRTLISAESPSWKDVAGDCYQIWNGGQDTLDRGLTPQRVLVEDNHLWVGFECHYPWSDNTGRYETGLLNLDLQSGRIISWRGGIITGDLKQMIYSSKGEETSPPYIYTWRYQGVPWMCRWNNTICVAQKGVGVLLYPADPVSGDRSLANVRILTEKNGLLHTEDIVAIAGMGDNLFIALPDVLMKWNKKSEGISSVVNLKSQDNKLPVSESATFTGLAANTNKNCLYAVMAIQKDPQHLPEYAVWRFETNTNQWIQIVYGIPAPWSRRYLFMMPERNMLYVARIVDMGKALTRCAGHYFYDIENERLIRAEEPQAPRFVLPEEFWPHFDVIPYQQGAIASGGAGSLWKIHYFYNSTNNHSQVLSWAKPDNKLNDMNKVVRMGNDRQEKRIASNKTDFAKDLSGTNSSLTGLMVAATTGRNQDTALLLAARDGKKEALTALLSQGADINTVDAKGWSPLIHAIEQNHPETALLLIRHGANVSQATRSGSTPMSFAADKKQFNVVKELLDRKADPNQESLEGGTPLIIAAQEGALDIARLLVDRGANINHQGRAGGHWTALFCAATEGHLEIVKLLIEHGAEVEKQSRTGRTVLMETVFRGYPEIVRYLIEHGAVVNRRNESQDQWTPLIYAAGCSTNTGVVACLIEKGADVNAHSIRGWTALMAAARCNQVEHIRLLLKAGADVMAINNNAKNYPQSAIDEARENPEAKALLQQAMTEYNKKKTAMPASSSP